MPTRRLPTAWIACFAVMAVLDGLWIGVVALPLYREGIGHLMAAQPRMLPALAFYLLYPLGLVLYAAAGAAGLRAAALRGAGFGFFCYATYDLTNLATLRDWPAWVSAMDLAWGTAVSAVSAAAGRAALGRGVSA